MPFATGGFIYEISVAIAEELHQEYSIVMIPHGRIQQELTSGNTDVICHASTIWNLPYKNDVYWSKPLYSYANVLVARKPLPWKKPSDVQQVTIGTVAGFYYADFEERFNNKTLFRDDAPSVAANVIKLLAERIDYVVMSEIEFNYYKKLYPQLRRSSFSEDKTSIQCALSTKSRLDLAHLNSAIDHLAEKKQLQKIYDRYATANGKLKPLTYGLNNNDSPPFIFFDKKASNQTVQGGVFFDLGLAMGKQLHRPINFVMLPRGRLDASLADGIVDFVCYDTVIWSGKFAQKSYWSLPIFRQINYVVYLKSLNPEKAVAPKTYEDLKGKTIGTTLHFVYPSLEAYFRDGSIQREDADSGLANVTKLKFGRVQFIILNNLEYGHYKKANPRLERMPIELDPIDVKCAVSKKSDLKIDTINKAIKEMQKTGKLQRIFE